jgi:exopolyphosphatase / guanosine-5'-triphosphate,3'-diphosphate pyrophosphatase
VTSELAFKMGGMRAAVLDVGSNTVRLLVAEQSGRGLRTILAEGTHLGLAVDIERNGRISQAKLAEAERLAARFAREARDAGAARIEVVVTAPGRQSGNADELLDVLADGANAPVRVLSAEQEGSLAYAGAVRSLAAPPESVAVCDVGGGSTQLLAGTAEGPVWMRPLDLGSLRLTARCLWSDPVTPAELAAAREEVDRCFDAVTPPLVRTVLATGGSARALRKLNGRKLGRKDFERTLELVVATPAARLAKRHRLQPERARTLAAGTLILAEAQRRFSVPLHVVREGVREGAVLALLSRAEAAA